MGVEVTNRLILIVAMVVTIVTLPSLASAQYVDRDDNVRFEEEFDKDDYMITARARAVAVPGFMLGLFFDRHTNHWSDGKQNFSFGGEFSWRRNDEREITFAIDWTDLSMPSGFWLESGDATVESDWTEIDFQMISFAVSHYWIWNVEKWFTPFLGGGIGAGFLIGDYLKYNPSGACRSGLQSGDAEPDACFTSDGEADLETAFDPPEEESLIPIVPIINITGGLRFNIGDHVVAKLEAGLYTYAYAGLAVGGQW